MLQTALIKARGGFASIPTCNGPKHICRPKSRLQTEDSVKTLTCSFGYKSEAEKKYGQEICLFYTWINDWICHRLWNIVHLELCSIVGQRHLCQLGGVADSQLLSESRWVKFCIRSFSVFTKTAGNQQ